MNQQQRHVNDLDGSLAYLEHQETVVALHEAEAEVRRLERVREIDELVIHDLIAEVQA